MDETSRTRLAAQVIGTEPAILDCDEREIAEAYRELTIAAECPVIDTSSAAIHQLAGAVHAAGYKVALTGEGADEALAGYPWFKVHRFTSLLDRAGAGEGLRRRFFHGATEGLPWEVYGRRYAQMGGMHATSDLYAVCSLSPRSSGTTCSWEEASASSRPGPLRPDTTLRAGPDEATTFQQEIFPWSPDEGHAARVGADQRGP